MSFVKAPTLPKPHRKSPADALDNKGLHALTLATQSLVLTML